jgi:hypothetical protein
MFSWSIETHDLQEILAGIDRYPRRLGGIDRGWEQSCSIRRGISEVLLTYYHVLQERRHQARQTILLCYFKKKSEEPPIDPEMAEDDSVDPDNPQPGHSSRQ